MKKLLQIRISSVFIGIVFVLIAFANNAKAATTYTWNGATSDFQTASNWGATTRTTLATNDILVFPAGTWNVTNVPTQTIATLTIQASAIVTLTPATTNTLTATGTSTIASGGSLTISSSLTFVPATLTITTGTLINNGTVTAVTLTVNTGASVTNNGTVTASTTLATSAGTGTFTQGTGANLTLGNTSTITTLNASAANNTVTYNRAGNQPIKAATYYNLTLTSTGTADAKTAGGILTVQGTLTTSGGAIFAYGAYAHHFEGDWVINSTEAAPIVVTAGSTINFDTPGTPAPTSIGGSTTATLPFINVNFNNTSGVTSNENLSTTGTMTVVSGAILSLPAAVTVTGAGTFTLASGGTLEIGSTDGITLAVGTATGNVRTTVARNFNTGANYTYNGTSAQVTGTGLPATANTLKINNAAGVTLSAAVTVTTLTIGDVTSSSIFSDGGFQVTSTGTLNLNNSGTFNIGSGGTATTYPGFTTNTISSGTTVNYNSTAAQTIAAVNYANLTNTANGNRTLASSGTIGVSGTFTPSSGTNTITSSTVDFNGTAAQSIPAFNFNNLTISGNKGGGAVTLINGGTIGVAGILSVTATNTSYTTTGNTVNFNGTAAQSIPAFNFNNLTISGNKGTGAVTLVNGGTIGVAGTLSVTATNTSYTTTGNTVDFNGTAAQSIPAFNFNNLTISGDKGAGVITLVNGGTIGVAGVLSLTATNTSYTTTGNTVDFNGAGTQTVSTTPSYQNLTFSGAGVKTTASGTLSVAGNWSIDGGTATLSTNNTSATVTGNISGSGAITMGSGTLTVSGNWTNNGTFTAGTGTVNYNGSSQTIAAVTYNNLTISQSAGNASLAADATVNGILNLSSGNLAVTDPYALTMGGSATTIGAKDVTGIVKRTSLVAATSYTFGNEQTIISFRNEGTLPTDVSVKISIGSAPSWKTDAVQRTYDIIQTGGSGNVMTLSLHYLDAELNGNTENTLVIWDADTPFTPGTAEEHGRSNYDLTNNWIGLSALDVSYLPTAFGSKAWSLANTAISSSTWNGSISTDWTNPDNWTPPGVPSDLTDVIIPDASTTPNDPTLGLSIAVGRLTINSGGILNAAATSTLTISGASGAWSNIGGTFNPSTGTVIFTNTAANISGATDFYNVTINSGGALRMATGGTMRIGGTITNNGIWGASGENTTVEYNGGSQTVLNPNGATPGYHSLILSGTGTKTMPGTTLSLRNAFSMSGTASATAAAAINTTGNFTIGTGTSFTTGAYTHTIGGDFSNSGTFTATGSTINFNGSGTQAINNANTWYNLSITGTAARTVTFQSGVAQTVSNSLTLTGASGQLLSLAPSASPTKWQLNAPATQSVSYVSASYSDASGGTTISADNGTNINNSNNINWNFSAQTTPTYSPAAGAIAFGTTVTISSAGADAIYYTIDGSDPTTASTNQAITPLVINSAVTVKALAVKAGSPNSAIGSAAYTQAASADLNSIVLSGSPSNYTFASGTYTYNGVTVLNGVSSITVTPTGAGIITVDGTTVSSGSASAAINFTAGVQKAIVIVATETGKSAKTYTINVTRNDITPTPTFSPVAGAIAFGTTVTISSTGADAIYYTTDGSDPTVASTLYSAPVTINSALTLKALAVKAGYDNSVIGSAAYTQAASADLTGLVLSGSPSNYTFASGTYTYNGVTVLNAVSSITVTPTGAGTITVDGTTVSSGSASGAIALTAGVQKAIIIVATETGKSAKTYTINITRNGAPQATPTFDPEAGAISFGNTVTITSAGADAIYYTTDGSDPTIASTLYSDPVTINSALTLKALAVRAGYDNSAIGSAAYTQAASADLSSIVLSGSPSNYTFASGTYTYNGVTVLTGVSSITVTPTGAGTITVDGTTVSSGSPSGAISLTVGVEKTIVIVVTETGKSAKTYTINITRSLDPSKAITAFTILGDGTVNEGAKTISVTVPCGTDVTALVAIFSTSGASVKVGSTIQVSGTTANNFTSPVTYTVTAADATTQDYVVTVIVLADPSKAITAFTILGNGTVNEGAKTIAVTVPYGTNVTSLVASFSTTGVSVKVGSTEQTSGTTANNFSSPVTYTVTAADATTQDYVVTVTVALNPAKAITAFTILGNGTINESAKTIAVSLPYGTDVSALVASFTTTGASVKVGAVTQTSGTTANNFSSPVTYTVTAADASTQDYVVTVTVAANPAKAITAFTILGNGTVNEGAKTIAVTVPYGTDVTALVATFTTTGASLKVGAVTQTSGTTANNFSSTVTYTVTAADASTQDYVVSVTVAANPAKAITAFTILGNGTVNEGTKTIAVSLPYGTDVSALVASFTTSGASVKVGSVTQTSGTTPNNFSSPVTFTVTAADATTQDYVVTVTVAANPAKAITAFTILGNGTVNEGAKTIAVTVPFGTDVTALFATFTTSGASVKIGSTTQTSGTTVNNFSSPVTYTVTAADASTQDYAVTVTVAANTSKAITAFTILGNGTVNESAKTIAVTVPYGTNVTALAASFTTTGASVKVGGTTQTSGATANNFSSPVTYTVTAADASTQDYVVTVTVALNPAKAITAFSIPGYSGTINESAKTVSISVPYGTSVNTLVATFTTTGASVKVGATTQVSGTTANNFSSPVTYTVTAADASTQDYVVSVTVAANTAKAITAFTILGSGTVNESAKTIAVTVPFGTNVTALVATFITTGASLKVGAVTQTSGTTANNFTSPVTYTVTAADATTLDYVVTVTVATNTSKAITAFTILGNGTVNEGTRTIAVTVPYGTDVTALAASFSTTGSSIKVGSVTQTSGTTVNNFSSPVTFTVTAADASTQDYVVTVTVAANPAKAITAFTILSNGTVNESTKTIAVTVPFGTDVSALIATFTTTGATVKVGGTTQTSGTTANNFSSPVTYTVTAADATTVNYVVTVSVPSHTSKALTVFTIQGNGTVNESAKTIAVTVPYGTNLNSLVATFNTSGASVKVAGLTQVSGITANNFSSPLTYTVTAADASTQNYVVTVTVAANPAKAFTAFTILGSGTVNESAKTIVVTLPYSTAVTALVATFNSTGTSVKVKGLTQTSGVSVNNFSSTVTYTITAADASTQDYVVTVNVAQNSAKAITAFSILGNGTVNESAKTIAVSVPFDTDLTRMVASFTTTGASVKVGGTSQVSGITANNFSSPVTYTVTAADASTQNYVATVAVDSNLPGRLTAGTIGTDQITCEGFTIGLTQITAATGGSGSYTYQWQKSILSSSTGFTDIAGATGSAHEPGTLSITTWYRRMTSSPGYNSVPLPSNVVTITVAPPVSNNLLIAPVLTNFCQSADPATIIGNNPSGGSGNYTYQWTSAPYVGACTSIPGATSKDYDPGVLTRTTYFKRDVISGGCVYSSNYITITVTPPMISNIISGNQTIISGNKPGDLTGAVPSGGDTQKVYLWESSTISDTSGFVPAAGINNLQNYSPEILTQTSFFRRKASSGVCPITYSNSVKITVTALSDKIVFGIAKAVSPALRQPDGFNSNIFSYKITVKNYGNFTLNTLQVIDDLSKTFPSPAKFALQGIPTSSKGILKTNSTFNGNTIISLLNPNSTLLAGESDTIKITVKVTPYNDMMGPFNNSAIASARDQAGNLTEDISTSGSDPDPDKNGIPEESTATTVMLEKVTVRIPEGFSPNGDGINDMFVIENLDNEQISLQVFNPLGTLIYKNDNYQNEWNGICNQGSYSGKAIPDGTYFYILSKRNNMENYIRFITIQR